MDPHRRIRKEINLAERGEYTYEYPRPMVTTDALVFAFTDGRLDLLLVRRKQDPFKGRWALPGGYIEMDEPLAAAAARELEEETGVSGVQLDQVGAFGNPNRDPRGRTIGVAYMGVTDAAGHSPEGADDAEEARWHSVDDLPALAFDHADMVATALAKLETDPAYAEFARKAGLL
jgi:8-oxo-dGTP diphosphatase